MYISIEIRIDKLINIKIPNKIDFYNTSNNTDVYSTLLGAVENNLLNLKCLIKQFKYNFIND